jgi:hypothetical protein
MTCMLCGTPCQLEKVSDRQSPTGLYRRDANLLLGYTGETGRTVISTLHIFPRSYILDRKLESTMKVGTQKNIFSWQAEHGGIDRRLYKTQVDRDLIKHS